MMVIPPLSPTDTHLLGRLEDLEGGAVLPQLHQRFAREERGLAAVPTEELLGVGVGGVWMKVSGWVEVGVVVSWCGSVGRGGGVLWMGATVDATCTGGHKIRAQAHKTVGRIALALTPAPPRCPKPPGPRERERDRRDRPRQKIAIVKI
jgi:hypothetical protein